MPAIQAGTDPNIPYPRQTFWFWEIVNILIPLIGILFLGWHIFTLVILFYCELLLWGGVGLLKILSANGAPTLLLKITTRIGAFAFFSILYLGLFLIVFSFSFVEFDSESILRTQSGLVPSVIVMAVNFLVEYFHSEIVTGRFRTRHPLEIIFERFIYALPLTALVVFAVIPLSQKFDGADAEKIIGLGLVLSKFLMDIAMHYLPGIVVTYHGAQNEVSRDQ